MGFDNVCNTGLVLGLGLETTTPAKTTTDINPRLKLPIISFEPSLTLALISGHEKKIVFKAADDHQDSSSGANSSFSNPSRPKREREGATGSEEPETTEILVSAAASTRLISDDFEDDDNNINARKKLRLTKSQSALLEESFKHHTTLNPKQKQELARDLNLRPRQVEVWFQNRRARTKLKQTEVEYEYLKKCCETLTDENRRLQKELQELKALKLMQPPLYMQLPAATLTMCPSCETIGGPTDKSSRTPFASKPHHHFYNPFTNHPSAAC